MDLNEEIYKELEDLTWIYRIEEFYNDALEQNVIHIITNYLNHISDCIDFYVIKSKDGYIIDDDGWSLFELSLLTKPKDLLDIKNILDEYGVSEKDGSLYKFYKDINTKTIHDFALFLSDIFKNYS